VIKSSRLTPEQNRGKDGFTFTKTASENLEGEVLQRFGIKCRGADVEPGCISHLMVSCKQEHFIHVHMEASVSKVVPQLLVHKFSDTSASAWEDVCEDSKEGVQLATCSKEAPEGMHVPAEAPCTVDRSKIPVANQVAKQTVWSFTEGPMGQKGVSMLIIRKVIFEVLGEIISKSVPSTDVVV